MFSVSSASDKMSTSEQRITGREETRLEKLKGDDLIWGRFSTINKIICDLNILLPVIWGIGSQIPILCQEFKVANDGEIRQKKKHVHSYKIHLLTLQRVPEPMGCPEGLQDSEPTSPRKEAPGLEEGQARTPRDQELQMVSVEHSAPEAHWRGDHQEKSPPVVQGQRITPIQGTPT